MLSTAGRISLHVLVACVVSKASGQFNGKPEGDFVWASVAKTLGGSAK